MILPGARSMLGRKPLVTPVLAGSNAQGVTPPSAFAPTSNVNVPFAYNPLIAPTSLLAGDLFMIMILGPFGFSSYNLGWSVVNSWPFTIFYCIYNGSALPSNFFQFSSTSPNSNVVFVFRGANPTTPLIASLNTSVVGSFITAPTVTPGEAELILNFACVASLYYPSNVGGGKGQASVMNGATTVGWTQDTNATGYYVEDSPSWIDDAYMDAFHINGVAGVSQAGISRNMSTYGNNAMGISIRILPL